MVRFSTITWGMEYSSCGNCRVDGAGLREHFVYRGKEGEESVLLEVERVIFLNA